MLSINALMTNYVKLIKTTNHFLTFQFTLVCNIVLVFG